MVRVTVARAELAAAARILREAVKDKSYRSTPLGLEVGRYCRWKRNEWGATTETMRDYEAILAKLALDHADLELSDFAPPIGTERLREFIDNRWGDKTARTRAKVISVLRDFFAWAVREGRLVGNPVIPIFRPRRRETARGTFTPGDTARLVAAQTRQRDRVALLPDQVEPVEQGIEVRQRSLRQFDARPQFQPADLLVARQVRQHDMAEGCTVSRNSRAGPAVHLVPVEAGADAREIDHVASVERAERRRVAH